MTAPRTPVPPLTADKTKVQTTPPPPPAESDDDLTSPTFDHSVPAGRIVGLPFLTPPVAGDLGRFGEYRVLRKLGEGGMGFVFQAVDPVLKRHVALKVMRPEVAARPQAADRFLREGRAAAGLKSDHIITIYQVGQANGLPYLAMEFLEGLPLDEWMKLQTKPVPLPHALRVVKDTLRGLAVAHEKNLTHRDIKPANLWIEKGTSRIKLLDFGLTRSNEADMMMTQEGAVVGTPAYMAPEQAGGKPVDPRADLFSVGTVFYHLLAGKNPFKRDQIINTLGAVSFETQKPLAGRRPDVPKAYSDYVDRLLAKDPAGRPANAKAALKELTAIEKNLHDAGKTDKQPPVVAVPLIDASPQVWGALTADEGVQVRTGGSAVGPVAPRPPAAKKLLVGGGVLAVVLGLAVGIVVFTANRDGGKAKVEGPTGTGGVADKSPKPAAAAVVPKPAPVAAADADRKAAEFALVCGGTVRIGARDYADAVSLPAGPFTVAAVDINLSARTAVTDADLELFRPLTGLTALTCKGPITDAGLARLYQSPAASNLTTLGLVSSHVTDDGLKAVPRFAALRTLAVVRAERVMGVGLAHLKGLPLDTLDLGGTSVRDAELVRLQGLPGLKRLSLYNTAVTDAGLAEVTGLSGLTFLSLIECPGVTDAGIRRLTALRGLEHLDYAGTGSNAGLTPASLKVVSQLERLNHLRVYCIGIGDADVVPLIDADRLGTLDLLASDLTDAGLMAFAKMKSLKSLNVRISKVTAAGVRAFRTARPDVTLYSEYAAAAAVDPDRRAAEFVIRTGGWVLIGGKPYRDAAKLPAGPFQVTAVNIPMTAKPVVTDADLERFHPLTGLTSLVLNGPVTDAGLAKLAACPWAASLTNLSLINCRLTDDAFQVLPKFSRLRTVHADGSKAITGRGLVHLAGMGLEGIGLDATGLQDRDLRHLGGLPKLRDLSVRLTGVSDDGLKEVGKLSDLRRLWMQRCPNVTDAGVENLATLRNLEYLAFADLGRSHGLTPAALATVATFPKLTGLEVGRLGITDADLRPLIAVGRLQNLDLNANAVTDAGLTALAELKSLRDLCVTRNKLTADGVRTFRAARPDVVFASDFSTQ